MINQCLKTILGVFFILFIFTHCCKETIVTNDIPPDDYRLWSKGSCNRYSKYADSASIAKPIWAADYVTTFLLPGDSLCRISIGTYYLSGVSREALVITNIPVKEKRVIVANGLRLNETNTPASDYTIYRDIKGFESSFESFDLVEAEKTNHITFTKIDKENNRVEGTFDLAFYSFARKDTLYFKNGTFVAAYPRKL